MIDGNEVKEIERIVKDSHTVKVGEKTYSSLGLKAVYHDPRPETLQVQSLDGILDYLKADIDKYSTDKIMIHVVDHGRVDLITNHFGESNKRHTIVSAVRDGVNFPFEKWIEQEEFIIKIQAMFTHTEDKDFILHHTAKIDSDSAIVTQDDGVTQKIQVRKGISGALTEAKDLKPIVKLKPFRTFGEIDQPESEFLFRMKENDGRVYCSLFEADNSVWKNTARKSIAEYLKSSEVAIIA